MKEVKSKQKQERLELTRSIRGEIGLSEEVLYAIKGVSWSIHYKFVNPDAFT